MLPDTIQRLDRSSPYAITGLRRIFDEYNSTPMCKGVIKIAPHLLHSVNYVLNFTLIR